MHVRLTLSLFAVSILGSIAVADDFQPDEAFVYKSIGDTQLELHVFKPSKLTDGEQRPAIVFFFGGGWNGGDPKQFFEQAEHFAKKGFVAFSADYRVRSRNKTTPFECVKDGKSAIRWVRQHAAEFHIDPNRIVASGGSAGGHVAACTGIIKGQEEAGEDLKVSSLPNAMILFNPVLDTTKNGYGAGRFSAEQQTTLSPNHHIRKGLVPTLVLHGTADTTVPFENAQRFERLMKNAGNDCWLVAFDGATHGFFNGMFFRPKTKILKPYQKCIEESEAFLDRLGFRMTSK